MPSSSATSLVDMTSVRVSGRPAGVAIYLREALTRESGPPAPTSGGACRVQDGRGASLLARSFAGFRNHAKAAAWRPAFRAREGAHPTGAESRGYRRSGGSVQLANERR